MTLTNENSYPVLFKNIEKETEKAYLINMPVCWAGNREHLRSFWFPKSCVEVKTADAILVAKFILKKLEAAVRTGRVVQGQRIFKSNRTFGAVRAMMLASLAES